MRSMVEGAAPNTGPGHCPVMPPPDFPGILATMKLFLALLMLAAVAIPASAQEATMTKGRESAEAFLGRSLEPLWGNMTPDMQAAFGAYDGLVAFREQLEQGWGTEGEVLGEEVQPLPALGVEVYLRTARWSNSEAPVQMQFAFDGDGRIAGFFVRQAPVVAESRFLDYVTKAPLRLPFDGEWFVVWGGRTLEQNYHAFDRAQQFALDLLIMRDGSSYAGDSADLASYYCWGQPILAPAAGTVARAVTDLPDNPIGETDATNPAGNHVVLDLGTGEFVFLAHMQQDSITVAEGDVVAAGQPLGLCGNSGNTSEPHLHLHLQTTTDLAAGEGLPAQFFDYIADGQPVARGEPLSGQTVSPAE